jgi:hypothetical protein
MMNRMIRWLVAPAAPALAAAVVLLPAAGATIRPAAHPPRGSLASTRVQCGTVTGARWSLSNGSIHFKGNRYVVSTEGGLSCALVRKWVRGLTRLGNHGAGRALRGPAGFKCTSLLPRSIGGTRAVAGGCVNRSAEFQWAPKSKLFSYS